jgi:transcription-repair coupling factor (superfamily II helicase)
VVQIDLPLAVGIPEEYIQDRSVRLSLYRRAAAILNQGEIGQLRKEFADRFGPPPETVENLLSQLEIKLLAEVAGLEGISIQNGQINLQYPEGKPLPQPWEFDIKPRFGESSVWIPFDLKSGDWVGKLLTILEGLTFH